MEQRTSIFARIVNKHDTEANWLLKPDFIPLKGELIAYDADDNYAYERFKIGDGVTTIEKLPFQAPQANWDQCDETKLDYIKNRPFYEESTAVTTTLFDGAISQPEMMLTLNATSTITGYDSYDIYFNGIEYKNLTCRHTDLYEGTYLYYYGNLSVLELGDDTEEPFVLAVANFTDESPQAIFIANSTVSENAALAIIRHGVELNIKQLDEKFIPDTIARIKDIPEVPEPLQVDYDQKDTSAKDFIKNRPIYDDRILLQEAVTYYPTNEPVCEGGIIHDTLYVLCDGNINMSDAVVTMRNSMVNMTDQGLVYDSTERTLTANEAIAKKYLVKVNIDGGHSSYPRWAVYKNIYTGNGYEEGTRVVSVSTPDRYEGELKQLDEKFIPDTIARKEDLSNEIVNYLVQPDWNQTDDSAKDYIKNKPFYDTRGKLLKLVPTDQLPPEFPEAVMERLAANYDSNTRDGFRFLTADYNAIPEDVLIEYSYYYPEYDEKGDMHYVRGITTIPLSEAPNRLKWLEWEYASLDITTDTWTVTERGSGWYTYSDIDAIRDNYFGNIVTAVLFYENPTGSVVQLDEKFIPDTITRQADWDQADETKSDYIKNKPTLAPVAKSGRFEDLIINWDTPIIFDGGGADVQIAVLDETVLL